MLLASRPDPEFDSVGGAEAVPTLRVDAEA
jgi:hypothetical protein